MGTILTKANLEYLEMLGQRAQEAIWGYEAAEELTLADDVRMRFGAYRAERQKMFDELNAIYPFGDLAEEKKKSLLSAIHRVWMLIKAKRADDQKAAVVEECLRGESITRMNYMKALETDWDPAHRDVLEAHLEAVRIHTGYLESLVE